MSYSELLDLMFSRGCNLADVALGSMMDIVEQETGCFPSWDDIVPDWILENCGVK